MALAALPSPFAPSTPYLKILILIFWMRRRLSFRGTRPFRRPLGEAGGMSEGKALHPHLCQWDKG